MHILQLGSCAPALIAAKLCKYLITDRVPVFIMQNCPHIDLDVIAVVRFILDCYFFAEGVAWHDPFEIVKKICLCINAARFKGNHLSALECDGRFRCKSRNSQAHHQHQSQQEREALFYDIFYFHFPAPPQLSVSGSTPHAFTTAFVPSSATPFA